MKYAIRTGLLCVSGVTAAIVALPAATVLTACTITAKAVTGYTLAEYAIEVYQHRQGIIAKAKQARSSRIFKVINGDCRRANPSR